MAGTLTLDYAADQNGMADITVRTTDTSGLWVESTFTVTVNPVNDAPMGMPTITGTVTEDQTLMVDTSGISDSDGLGVFNFQWLRDGAAIAGATGSTYTLGDHDVGAQISVQVSYTDGQGTPESLISAQVGPVANVNDAPTTTPVALTPIAEDSGPRLITQAELLANAGDADGDSLTAAGLAITSGNGSLVDNGDGTWTYTPVRQ